MRQTPDLVCNYNGGTVLQQWLGPSRWEKESSDQGSGDNPERSGGRQDNPAVNRGLAASGALVVAAGRVMAGCWPR
jgi:hypothetical protein